MTRPITLFTGQWADLPFEEVARLAGEWGYDGLEIACWGDHLDVSRWDDADVRAVAARHPRAQRAEGLRDLEPPHRPGGLRRPDRRASPRHPVGPRVGRRRPRGRAAARGRGSEGHRAVRREARREDGQRLLGSSIWKAVAMFPPASRSSSRAATRTSPTAGTRSSTSSKRSACGSRSRCTRPRSPTTTGRRKTRSRRSATARASGSTSTRRTSSGSSWTTSRSSSTSPTTSSTCT